MPDLKPSFALQGTDGRSWLFETERLKLQAVNDVRKLRLQVKPHAELDPTPLEALIGITLPANPREKADEEHPAFWLAPNDWLLVNPVTAIDNIDIALKEAANGATSCVTDVSDAYSIIDISGEDAAPKLAEGCSVDLDDKVFPSGRYVLTRLQHLSVIIHRLDGAGKFRVLVDRSMARFLRDWLGDDNNPMSLLR